MAPAWTVLIGVSNPGTVALAYATVILSGSRVSFSGVTFEDQGTQDLKGVTDPLRVYAVETRSA